MSRPQVVFVLGRPGSGKGTQCLRICQNFGFTHLSAGDLLREEQNQPNSKYGSLIDTYIREGNIVPVEITCSLLQQAMRKDMEKPGSKGRFLIDGFPRNQDNYDGWNKSVADSVDFKFVLFFDCPEEECFNRCMSRGASGSGRADDNAESLRKRFTTFQTQTLPIVEIYEKDNRVKRVDGKADADQVFEQVKQIFESFK